MNRTIRILVFTSIDSFSISISFFLGLILLKFNLNSLFDSNNLYILSICLLVAIPFYLITKGYKGLTKYIGSNELYILVMRNILLISLIYLIIKFSKLSTPSINFWIIFCLLIIFFTGGIRFILRDLLLSQILSNKENIKTAAIYGAGEAGTQLYASILLSKSHNIITFIDDSPYLWGRSINNISVKSNKSLEDLKDKIDVILLAIPSLKKERRSQIIGNIQSMNIPILEVPSFEDITSGKSKINELRPILIEELLWRKPVDPDQTLLAKGISGKVIFVTGGGGSIGSELCHQIIKLNPKKLILLEIHEHSLYKINEELKDINKNDINILPILGSATDKVLIRNILVKEDIDIIFHAAAYKHVPIVEKNPISGIINNISSTRIICSLAKEIGVKKVMLVSTDKAVRPTSVMGASKRLAEIIVQNFSRLSKDSSYNKTSFSIVRFGNVLNSSGSVVPIFRKQIAAGGPITLTHAEINRYFMTIKEASQLVIQAAILSEGGEVFLLDMGKPVKIRNLAERMILLSGLTIKSENNRNGDIEIIETGLRPGEKIFEELLIDSKAQPTIHPLIYKANENFYDDPNLDLEIDKLENSSNHYELSEAIEILTKIIPEWKRNI